MKLIFCLFFSAFLLIGCTNQQDDGVTEIVTTSTMITDMVKTIVGDAESDTLIVKGLIPAGVDPHSYVPSAIILSDLKHADLIIYNGMHLEGKMTDSFENRGAKALAITDLLPKDKLITPEMIDEDFGDPHVWGDIDLWSKAVPGVVAKLSELVPEKKDEFAKRGEAYQKQLFALHAWTLKRMQEVPEANRTLITSHDAFSYFGDAYKIRVVGIKGISTTDEAGGGDLLGVIDLIKKENIKAIFRESSTNDSEIKRVASQAKVKIGDTLFSDSCGAAGNMETSNGETYDQGTYIGMMKHNINAIVEALK